MHAIMHRQIGRQSSHITTFKMEKNQTHACTHTHRGRKNRKQKHAFVDVDACMHTHSQAGR